MAAFMDKAKQNGAPPTHAAAQEGHSEALQVLIAARVNVNFQMPTGATPTYFSSHNKKNGS